MASEESMMLISTYERWGEQLKADPDNSLKLIRDGNERLGDLTGEPGGVDFIEEDCDGVAAMWLIPKQARTDTVILCCHGGGHLGGSMYSQRKLWGHLAKRTGCRALTINYRLAPENLFPADIEDIATAHRWLVAQGVAEDRIAFAGDSAGGAIALAAQLLARDEGRKVGAATLLLSPWLDMEASGASMTTNEGIDRLVTRDVVLGAAHIYLGEAVDRRNPWASPIHGDYNGFGPIYVQSGGDEAMLDDGVRLQEAAARSGVDATIDIIPEMQHSFHIMAGAAPEADLALDKGAAWLRAKLAM